MDIDSKTGHIKEQDFDKIKNPLRRPTMEIVRRIGIFFHCNYVIVQRIRLLGGQNHQWEQDFRNAHQ